MCICVYVYMCICVCVYVCVGVCVDVYVDVCVYMSMSEGFNGVSEYIPFYPFTLLPLYPLQIFAPSRNTEDTFDPYRRNKTRNRNNNSISAAKRSMTVAESKLSQFPLPPAHRKRGVLGERLNVDKATLTRMYIR